VANTLAYYAKMKTEKSLMGLGPGENNFYYDHLFKAILVIKKIKRITGLHNKPFYGRN
jgi:hypothetical protein